MSSSGSSSAFRTENAPFRSRRLGNFPVSSITQKSRFYAAALNLQAAPRGISMCRRGFQESTIPRRPLPTLIHARAVVGNAGFAEGHQLDGEQAAAVTALLRHAWRTNIKAARGDRG